MNDDITIRGLRAIGSELAKNRVEPNQNGEYFVILSQDYVQELRHMSVRELHKWKSHNERYKRRYGEYPKEYKMEIGEIERFLFVSRSNALKLRVYIAGPMTGKPNLNFPAFHAKAAELRALGHHVINPAELNGGADELVACADMSADELAAHWQRCMRKDITELMTCDAIALLPGWQNSRGATLEHHVAAALRFAVLDHAEEVSWWTSWPCASYATNA